jgi:hypothetical protein
MPLRLVQLGIRVETIKTETSIFYQTVKNQLNPLTITRSILKRSGIAITPLKIWINIRVQLVSVPGHRCTDGSGIADQLVRMELECPFIGPELAYSISAGVAKKTVRA